MSNGEQADTRWGLTLPLAGVPLAGLEPFVRRAEELGYQDMWSGDTSGPDGFTPLVLAGAWTERMRLGTGIVNVFTRSPAVLAQHAAAIQDATEGRFVLGLGSSSNVIVERWNGVPFRRPLTRVRETVEVLRGVLAGERGPGGFRLEQPPSAPIPIYVAALRERMLELAGEVGDGAFLNFLPLSGLPTMIEHIRAGEQRAGKASGSVDVACRFFCIPQSAEEGMATARWMFAAYATVPVYAAFFRWLGWGEQLDPMVAAWEARDRQRAVELAPEELIRDIFIFGDPAEQRARLDQYAAGGIRTLVLTPITGADTLEQVIEGLAR